MSKRIDAILRKGFDDYRELVNPVVALRAELTGEPAKVTRTDGGRLVDSAGHLIEDFHGTQAFGHRHPAITQAVRELLDSDSPSWFPSRVNPYAGSLARRLCERANAATPDSPPAYSNAYFASSGSEAVESALKLARAVTGRPRVLSLAGAYHGCTMGSCGLMNPGPYRDPFAPHVPGLGNLPFGDVDALAAALAAGDVAAVVAEPIQLEGGVRPLPHAYVQALCDMTAAHAALDLLDDALIARVGELGAAFRAGLDEALSGLPLFAEVRGAGLIAGIALKDADHPWLSFEHFGMQELAGNPTVGLLLCHRLYKRGFFCLVCGHDWSVLRLQPRFTIDAATLASFTAIVREELTFLCDLA